MKSLCQECSSKGWEHNQFEEKILIWSTIKTENKMVCVFFLYKPVLKHLVYIQYIKKKVSFWIWYWKPNIGIWHCIKKCDRCLTREVETVVVGSLRGRVRRGCCAHTGRVTLLEVRGRWGCGGGGRRRVAAGVQLVGGAAALRLTQKHTRDVTVTLNPQFTFNCRSKVWGHWLVSAFKSIIASFMK